MKQIVSNYTYSPTANAVTLTGINIEQDQLLLIVAPQVGRTMYNFASGVTGSVVAGANTRVNLNASTVGLTTTSPLVIFYDDQVATQTIAGTVTANLAGDAVYYDDPNNLVAVKSAIYTQDIFNELQPVGASNPLPISGTVTANVLFSADVGETMPPQAVALGFYSGDDAGIAAVNDSNRKLPISGTVTIGAMPRVTFLDGSGTVTTANSAITVFASSSTRSYLLVQVTTGSAFVNVGATATTLNGINLTAGQGYAWETTIPQGIVSLISATTSTNYVAKQA